MEDKTNVLIGEEDDDLVIVEEPSPEVITVDDDEPSSELHKGIVQVRMALTC